MNAEDHEPTTESNKVIMGDNRRGKPTIIIYNGIKGGLKYWAQEKGMTHQCMASRTRKYSHGDITFEEMMTNKPIHGRMQKGKPGRKVQQAKPRILPSGIREAWSLV